jgi:hypothetical protein
MVIHQGFHMPSLLTPLLPDGPPHSLGDMMKRKRSPTH